MPNIQVSFGTGARLTLVSQFIQHIFIGVSNSKNTELVCLQTRTFFKNRIFGQSIGIFWVVAFSGHSESVSFINTQSAVLFGSDQPCFVNTPSAILS